MALGNVVGFPEFLLLLVRQFGFLGETHYMCFVRQVQFNNLGFGRSLRPPGRFPNVVEPFRKSRRCNRCQ